MFPSPNVEIAIGRSLDFAAAGVHPGVQRILAAENFDEQVVTISLN
jgi:hypothetical protein